MGGTIGGMSRKKSTVYIEEAADMRLEAAARKLGASKAELIRRFIDEGLLRTGESDRGDERARDDFMVRAVLPGGGDGFDLFAHAVVADLAERREIATDPLASGGIYFNSVIANGECRSISISTKNTRNDLLITASGFLIVTSDITVGNQ